MKKQSMIVLCDYCGLLDQSINRLGFCAVYVLFAATTKLVKIGFSEKIRKRVSSIQSSCPDELTLEYLLWCETKRIAGEIEAACHDRLAERKIRGEWFNVPLQDVINEIEDYSARTYPKKEFYTHEEFVLKYTPISKEIAESVERRADERKIHSLTSSLGGYQVQRSRYLARIRI